MNSDDTAGESKDVRRKRAIRVALFTTIIGLVVGAALIVGGSLLVELSRDGLDTIAIPPAAAIAGATGIVILFAYVFGGLFALVAAVALARYVFLYGNVGYAYASVVAVLSAAAGTCLLDVVFGLRDSGAQGYGELSPLLIPFVPISLASALICRWLMDKFGVLPPDSGTSLAGH